MPARANHCAARCSESSHIPHMLLCSVLCAPCALCFIARADLFSVSLSRYRSRSALASRDKRDCRANPGQKVEFLSSSSPSVDQLYGDRRCLATADAQAGDAAFFALGTQGVDQSRDNA